MREHGVQVGGTAGTQDLGWKNDLLLDDVFIQKEDGAEGLVLLAPNARTMWV